jgi:hypothetical protein
MEDRMTGRLLALAAGLSIAMAPALNAQTKTLLDDLPVVGVHVIGVSPVAAGVGVDSVDLRQRLARQLTRGGFRVPSQAELEEQPNIPRLILNIGLFTTNDSSSVFSVVLELLELVQLKRNGLETHAAGWSEQVLGISPVGESADATRGAAAALVELFLAQSRAASTAAGAGGGR